MEGIKYLVHDRDSIFSKAVRETMNEMGIKSKRIAAQSPWQNGVAERWVGSCRRDLLDHVILNT